VTWVGSDIGGSLAGLGMAGHAGKLFYSDMLSIVYGLVLSGSTGMLSIVYGLVLSGSTGMLSIVYGLVLSGSTDMLGIIK
jgi:hypothetical protein